MLTTRSERSVEEPTLYVAFELGKKSWSLGLTPGLGMRPWVRTVTGGDLGAVRATLDLARKRFGLPSTARVVSCYEAGRDGFWVHRAVTELGVANVVVDSSSIEVSRRARRAKTDRLDAIKLVLMLVRFDRGEPDVWKTVRVPAEAVEAARHVSRERNALVKEQTRLTNQLKSWLATFGCGLPSRRTDGWWTRLHDWRGRVLPGEVQQRLARVAARLALVVEQLAEIEAQQAAEVQQAAPDSPMGRLVQLKAVSTTSASVLLGEGLIWRDFQNRRQVGGLLGFAPMHHESGEIRADTGISRAGNTRLQAVSIQLAWNWIRWQPASALTQWYRQHFGGRRRARRIGIVAVARKLLIALWRYATTGVLPAGAILKPTTA